MIVKEVSIAIDSLFSLGLMFVIISMNPLLAYASTIVPPPPAQPAVTTSATDDQNQPRPGIIMIITFENGTTKAIHSVSTDIRAVQGGYFISDPSVTAAKPLQSKVVPQTIVGQLVKIFVSIRFDNPILSPVAQPDNDCLFDPSLPKCIAVNGQCPTAFAINEDGQCFPIHEKCPSGYHSHEDDESGRCMSDSTPCAPGYAMNPDFPSCDRKEYVCDEHPDATGCSNQEEMVVEESQPLVNNNGCSIDPSQGACLYEPQPGDSDNPPSEPAPAPEPDPDSGSEQEPESDNGNEEQQEQSSGDDNADNNGGDDGGSEGGGAEEG
ncbi:MAG: hypothetical protein ACRD47_08780 [Nitrososphaeraceae archaeon]